MCVGGGWVTLIAKSAVLYAMYLPKLFKFFKLIKGFHFIFKLKIELRHIKSIPPPNSQVIGVLTKN